MKLSPLLIAIAALAAQSLHAESPVDPIGGNLFPPEFIMANADAINFSDEQRQTLLDTMEKAQPRFVEMQETLKREVDALGQLLAQPSPDETAVLAQFDKLQDREREVKRAQLTLMLRIRGKLTDVQRAKLTELRAKNPGQQPQQEFMAKMERIKAGVEKWQNAGRDPSQIGQMMQQFDTLMRSGRMDQAGAMLDQALKALGSDGK